MSSFVKFLKPKAANFETNRFFSLTVKYLRYIYTVCQRINFSSKIQVDENIWQKVNLDFSAKIDTFLWEISLKYLNFRAFDWF